MAEWGGVYARPLRGPFYFPAMDRVAVFVDAGYLFAQASRLLAGQKLTRGQLALRHDVVIEKLRSLEVFGEVPTQDREGLILSVLEGGQIPRDVDARFLTRAAKILGGVLQPARPTRI